MGPKQLKCELHCIHLSARWIQTDYPKHLHLQHSPHELCFYLPVAATLPRVHFMCLQWSATSVVQILHDLKITCSEAVVVLSIED